MKELFHIKDLANYLRVSNVTIRRLLKKKAIPYHRIGRRYVFTETDINLYLSNTMVPMKEEVINGNSK